MNEDFGDLVHLVDMLVNKALKDTQLNLNLIEKIDELEKRIEDLEQKS